MKKKIIIISFSILAVLAIIFLILFSGNESSKILKCSMKESDGAKVANITYTYTVLEDNKLKIESITELSFLNKEEADKYEKVVTLAFFKDKIVRDGNTITITSDKEDDSNELTLEEIRQQQEEKGFDCN